MTPLAEILRDEIHRDGPISFARFMEMALYHPEFGYYRRPHDPFGVKGDFYTAEQLQPVFGILIAERIRQLRSAMGGVEDFTVVELGAGRGEMAAALGEFRYVPVEIGSGELPEGVRGVIFSNEFFDSLPVHVAVMRVGAARELRVGWNGERFAWVEAGPAPDEVECYRKTYLGALTEGHIFEVGLKSLEWLDRISGTLDAGYVFSIDYGYMAPELTRFPTGTLMSYRRHQALDDVLNDPGEQDITAHVCFSAMEEFGKTVGLETAAFGPLARTLIEAGEADQFARALGAESPAQEQRRRLQLKQLLFGMGETFRTLIQRKGGQK
ncbi:MAG TPA: SAM-dependent methyltransferase [Terriglobales bacterium]|nr:SAM-dependent methyltransferase [Terriglobales bacterium]